jgi:carboxyl-terminal processing protease
MRKIFNDLTRDEVFEIYINSLAHSYDWHTDYMGKATFDNFKIQMSLHLFGIGAQLQSKDGYCVIKELLPGPAMNSKKVKSGDRIVAVAQGDEKPVDVVGMPLNKVVEKIRGQKGTEVRITIIPADAADSSAREIIALIRDEIHLDEQETKAKIFEMPTEKGSIRLGWIDLPSFYADMDQAKGNKRKTATGDVGEFLKRFEKEHVKGVILDLRNNGGGYLEEAITLTGQFVGKEPVVQTKESTGEIITETDPDPSILYDGPLVILTSRGSASASEILAGALQDYGRALIVGDRSTFGKGTVQTTQPLGPLMDQRKIFHEGDPGTIKPTIRKFYRAGGSSTQLKGVVPDIELPSVNNFAEFGEAYLPNTLPWDTVPSAEFHKLNRVKPYLDELQKKSNQRLQKDKDFIYVREDIDQYKKTQADKSVSLNESERVTERKDLDTKMEARKKERIARKKSNEKVFELTLKNVEDAELHLATAKTNKVSKITREVPMDEEEEPAVPDVDVRLEETKRILADYIALLAKDESISKAH